MNRPLVWVAVGLALGGYLAAAGLLPGLAPPIVLWFVGLLLTLFPVRFGGKRLVSVLLCFLGAGALLWNARYAGPPGDALSRYSAAHPDTRFTLEGRVRRADLVLPGERRIQFLLDVDRVIADGKPLDLDGGVIARGREGGTPLYTGQRVRVAGTLRHVLGPVNPGIQDVEDYLRRHGIHSVLRLREQEAVEFIGSAPWWSPFYCASRLRQVEANRLVEALPESVFPFVLTVWLGDRSGVSREEYQRFVESGTAHILAVSGVHAGIVFLALSFLLRLVTNRRKLRTALTMAGVLLFALVAGARITSMRAGTMIAMYLIAELFDREPDAPTALSVSAVIFMLLNPAVLIDHGFLLSFASVASILIFADPIQAYLSRLPSFLTRLLAPTLAVQALPLPLAVHFFHVLPLAAPFANLLVLPLLTITLGLCLFTTIAALVFPGLAVLFGHALVPVVFLIRTIVEAVAGTGFAHLRVTSPTALAMACYWAGIACLWAAGRRFHRRMWIVAGLASFVLVVVCWRPWRPEPEVTFLDVGHGDAAVVRTPAGGTALIDGGDANPYVDMGERVVAPFLWTHHIAHLDYVILSHPDRDHIGGLFYVVSHFSVGEVLLTPGLDAHQAQHSLITECAKRNIPVRHLHAGEIVSLGDASLDVLHPPVGWPEGDDVNDHSIVIRLRWPGPAVLFTGDVEAAAESAVRQRDCAAPVLKVPHHGSRTSSSPDFVAAVAPRHAIVSTGGHYGRECVNDAVLDRYTDEGAVLWRTDELGGVTLSLEEDGAAFLSAARATRGYLTQSDLAYAVRTLVLGSHVPAAAAP